MTKEIPFEKMTPQQKEWELLKQQTKINTILFRRDLMDNCPSGWFVEDLRTNGPPGKERMTLRIDKDVAKFFRVTGGGFQEKMNDVLRAFMMAAQLRVLEGDVEKIGTRKPR